MNRLLRLTCALMACAGVLVSAGCGSDSSSPSSEPAYSTLDLQVGTGATAAAGNSVTVNYTGWLYDSTKPDSKGTQFDSSLSPGRGPFPLIAGGNGAIQGFSQAVIGMRVGGTRRVVMPSSLAYGASGQGSIPPYAPLVFEITLLTVS